MWTSSGGVSAKAALRMLGGVVAVVSAAVAVFLVVFGDASRSTSLGILLGLWAAVIGALSVVKVQEPAAAAPSASPAAAEPPPAEVELIARPRPTIEELAAGMALELRRNAELEREAAAAERREFQLQLELMLRREVENVLKHEMAALRHEVAGLRAEILEHVGGQLRLERIETTRLIGSDVQALQREVRRLASVREALESSMDSDVDAATIHEVLDDILEGQLMSEPVEAEPVEAEPVETEAVETEAVEAEAVEADAEVEAPDAGQAEAAPADVAEPEVAVAEVAEESAPVAAPHRPEVTRRRREFDFADLPSVSRLTPLPDAGEASDRGRYTGRRRAQGAERAAAGDESRSEESGSEGPLPSSGGQRRAREDADDVLARLLGR